MAEGCCLPWQARSWAWSSKLCHFLAPTPFPSLNTINYSLSWLKNNAS